MRQLIAAAVILLIPLVVLAEKDIPIVAVSCFRTTDNLPACQIKKKTYTLLEFLKELPKLKPTGDNQAVVRFTVARDFPSGALLNLLSASQDAGFTKIEAMPPSSLPRELIDSLPRKELKIQLLELYREADKSEQSSAPYRSQPRDARLQTNGER